MQIEGAPFINGIVLHERDAIEIVGEDVSITAEETSQFLVVKLRKQE